MNYKLTSFTFFTVYFYFPSMRFYNIITQTQPQSCPLSCWFCGEEWLKNFICNFLWNTDAVILYMNLNALLPQRGANFFCANRNSGLVICFPVKWQGLK